ncbi:MAG: NosD domain-containing protein, partial [Promethearchaeota archaeon]
FNNLIINMGGTETIIEIWNSTRHIIIQYCVFSSANNTGIGIFLKNCTHVKIIGCWIGNLSHGLYLYQCSNVSVENNTLMNNQQMGLKMENCSFIRVYNNTFKDNGGYGVFISDSFYNEVTFNYFANNNLGCIFLVDSAKNTILENRCDTPAKLDGYLPMLLIACMMIGFVFVLGRSKNSHCNANRKKLK